MQPISATRPMWRFSGVTGHLAVDAPDPPRVPDEGDVGLDPADRKERVRLRLPRRRRREPARPSRLVPEEVERG